MSKQIKTREQYSEKLGTKKLLKEIIQQKSIGTQNSVARYLGIKGPMLSRFLNETQVNLGSDSLKQANKLILATKVIYEDSDQLEILKRLLQADKHEPADFIGSSSYIPYSYIDMLEDVEARLDQPRIFIAPFGTGMKKFFDLLKVLVFTSTNEKVKLLVVDCQKAIENIGNQDPSFQAFASQIIGQIQEQYPKLQQTGTVNNFTDLYTNVIAPVFPKNHFVLAFEKLEIFDQEGVSGLLNLFDTLNSLAHAYQSTISSSKGGSLRFWYILEHERNSLHNSLLASGLGPSMTTHKPVAWNWRDVNNFLYRTICFGLLENGQNINEILDSLQNSKAKLTALTSNIHESFQGQPMLTIKSIQDASRKITDSLNTTESLESFQNYWKSFFLQKQHMSFLSNKLSTMLGNRRVTEEELKPIKGYFENTKSSNAQDLKDLRDNNSLYRFLGSRLLIYKDVFGNRKVLHGLLEALQELFEQFKNNL